MEVSAVDYNFYRNSLVDLLSGNNLINGSVSMDLIKLRRTSITKLGGGSVLSGELTNQLDQAFISRERQVGSIFWGASLPPSLFFERLNCDLRTAYGL